MGNFFSNKHIKKDRDNDISNVKDAFENKVDDKLDNRHGKALIKSTFLNVFSQGLKPFGFKKMKGTNFLGKLFNNEILYYIGYHADSATLNIKAGIMTIYSCQMSTPIVFEQYAGSFYVYYFLSTKQYSTDNIIKCIEELLESCKSIILPVFNQVVDLKSYIEYMKGVNGRIDLLRMADKLWNNDSLVMLKADNHDDFSDVMERCKKYSLERYKNVNNPEYIKDIEQLNEAIIKDIVESRDKVYNNPELFEKAMNIIEQRKNENIQLLSQYGFKI